MKVESQNGVKPEPLTESEQEENLVYGMDMDTLKRKLV